MALTSTPCGVPSRARLRISAWMASSPRRLIAGTRTSVNDSSAVSCPCSPSLSRAGRSNPGASRSTTSRVRPRWGWSSVRATTMTRSALIPLVMKVLAPVEHVAVALAHRFRADAGQIAAGLRFGDSDGDHGGAGGDPGKPAGLLFVARVQEVGRTRIRRESGSVIREASSSANTLTARCSSWTRRNPVGDGGARWTGAATWSR